jgi:hypothetical protein
MSYYPNVYASQTGPLLLSGLDANFNFAVDIQSQSLYASAGGSSDIITATLTPAVTSLISGLTLYIRAATANTTTTPTFSPNSLTAKTIVKANNIALAVGDIAGSGHILILQYDATNGVWELANPATANTSFPGGTANGVLYLNGSKIATSGAALTFDGTNFATTGTATAAKLIPTGSSVTGNGMYLPATNAVGISTNGTNAVYIDSSQNVGIGTTSPAGKLEVSSAISNEIRSTVTSSAGNVAIFRLKSPVSNYGWYTSDNTNICALYDYNASAERMRIDSSGNVLVGQNLYSSTVVGVGVNPAGLINIAQSTSTSAGTGLQIYSTGAAAYRFYVDMGGTIHATSIVITAISDERLKENIRDIDTGLSDILSLKPRRFDWKEGKGQDKKNAAGFIAQEFEEVFPECVGVSKAGGDDIEYKNINHETLIPTLVKAIQEQQALITSLTTRIAALEAK